MGYYRRKEGVRSLFSQNTVRGMFALTRLSLSDLPFALRAKRVYLGPSMGRCLLCVDYFLSLQTVEILLLASICIYTPYYTRLTSRRSV